MSNAQVDAVMAVNVGRALSTMWFAHVVEVLHVLSSLS